MVRSRALSAVLLLAALALAACESGGDRSGGDRRPSRSGDAVAWAERVCTSVAPELRQIHGPPDDSDLKKFKAAGMEYMGAVAGLMKAFRDSVEDAGVPPVAGGKEAMEDMLGVFGKVHNSMVDLRSRLADLPTDDRAAFSTGWRAISQDMDIGQDFSELDTNDELEAAFEKARSCTELEGFMDR